MPIILQPSALFVTRIEGPSSNAYYSMRSNGTVEMTAKRVVVPHRKPISHSPWFRGIYGPTGNKPECDAFRVADHAYTSMIKEDKLQWGRDARRHGKEGYPWFMTCVLPTLKRGLPASKSPTTRRGGNRKPFNPSNHLTANGVPVNDWIRPPQSSWCAGVYCVTSRWQYLDGPGPLPGIQRFRQRTVIEYADNIASRGWQHGHQTPEYQSIRQCTEFWYRWKTTETDPTHPLSLAEVPWSKWNYGNRVAVIVEDKSCPIELSLVEVAVPVRTETGNPVSNNEYIQRWGVDGGYWNMQKGGQPRLPTAAIWQPINPTSDMAEGSNPMYAMAVWPWIIGKLVDWALAGIVIGIVYVTQRPRTSPQDPIPMEPTLLPYTTEAAQFLSVQPEAAWDFCPRIPGTRQGFRAFPDLHVPPTYCPQEGYTWRTQEVGAPFPGLY